MSIEEKARAYDEALEKAREHINSKGIGDTVDLCKHLFPQLCESEDERIRKYLISELKVANSVGELKFSIPQPTREDCIAYLEKQKEQKHPDGCFTCDEYKKGYEEGRRNGFTAGYNKAIKEVEQNVEQKPAEWSEEDERRYLSCLNRLETGGPSQPETVNSKWFKEHVSFRPSWKLSEEDKQCLDTAIELLENLGYDGEADNLKQLKKQI